MTFLIRACEGIYQGLHGIEDIEIIEAQDLDEIHGIATEMSIELMGAYTSIVDELETYVKDEIDFNDTVKWTEERIEKLRDQIYSENVYYDLYELDEEKIKNKSIEDLEQEAYDDLEEFLANYEK